MFQIVEWDVGTSHSVRIVPLTNSLRERVDVQKKRSGERDVKQVWHVPMTSDEQTLFRAIGDSRGCWW